MSTGAVTFFFSGWRADDPSNRVSGRPQVRTWAPSSVLVSPDLNPGPGEEVEEGRFSRFSDSRTG